MEWFQKIPAELFYVILAAVGGTARYLQAYLNEGKFAIKHFCAHIVISAFSGYMFYQFAFNFLSLPETVIPVVAGLGGWMGVESMKMLEDWWRKKINK